MAHVTAPLFGLDPAAEIERIVRIIQHQVHTTLRRDGVVIAMSGGIDSSVCAALCTRALGPENVLGVANEDIRLHLESHNIESRHVWKPMHMQPVFNGCRIVGGAVSEDLFSRGLCLPSGSAMSDADVDRVAETILAFVKERTAQVP